ncbi:MAG: ABC transporter permease subunit [Aigarchaeota archaeon]|nr:ABC transporter permease subunit [Aigarchaeota archaeon]MCX8193090.1 ABC transporter permease subunit [Nitrososphaeria archaeon]MDW7986939.1 ABC transporter permease subunit [Nitrososphaerota archaeon]
MSIALIISTIFSIIVGIAAAVNKTLEKIIIPILDILQSIPILGFFPVALYAFIALHPIIGAEIATIFLIFTSQAWNITFGVYESIKIIPMENLEVVNLLRFDIFKRMRYLYIPASFPKIFANLPSSWANGLYFLVACEIITIGEAEYKLFGIGSLTVELITSRMIYEAIIALLTVAVLVILMNLLVFIPLIRISARYRFETYATEIPHAWFEKILRPFSVPVKIIPRRPRFSEHWEISTRIRTLIISMGRYKRPVTILAVVMAIVILACTFNIDNLVYVSLMLFNGFQRLGVIEPLTMLGYSLLRVFTALLITLGWTIPLSIILYEKNTLEKILLPAFQVLASFPATLLIPFIMNFIMETKLMKEFGALIIILLGTQWYLLFSLRGALSIIPREEEELSRLLRMSRMEKLWYLYLPRMSPSMVTGCIVTVGGAWNTLVIAERTVLDHIVWEVENPGIGKMLNLATYLGDIELLIASTIWMALFIVLLNRFFWRRIYEIVVRRLV